MNRLTRKIEGGYDAFGAPLASTYEIIDDTPGLAMAKVRCQLGRYEDTGLTPDEVAELAGAKAQGRLVILPCKVGDKVYRILQRKNKMEIVEFEVDYVSVKPEPVGVCFRLASNKKAHTELWYTAKELLRQETVQPWHRIYLTREEAETALSRQQS